MKRFIAPGLLGCLLTLASCLSAHAQTNKSAKPFPKFALVVDYTHRYFHTQSGYRPGDIISSSQVEMLLQELRLIGWNVADSKVILRDVLGDNAFLCQNLRTQQGKKFMRQVAKLPHAYDRLDRLARLPYGERSIKRLINGPDGYKLIEYMTTSSGGRGLGVQLSQTPRGTDFNKPTGKIYDETQLLARLAKSYKAELERRRKLQAK